MDPRLADLLALKGDGLLQAWIVLNGADAGIARDYAAYRAAHHDESRAYLDKYVIRPAPPANPPNGCSLCERPPASTGLCWPTVSVTHNEVHDFLKTMSYVGRTTP